MGLFQKIVQGIKKTKDAFSKKLFFAFSARELNDEFYENLEEALLTADVGITATENLIDELKDEIFKRKIKKPEDAKGVLAELMTEDIDYDIPEYEYPLVILLSGVNGVGKTTAIGKLAHMFKEQGHSVVVAAADTFRAAASEQLEVWGERAGVRVIRHNEGADPAAVVFDAISSAKAKGNDVILVDTAGRLHNKKNLMDELKKITRICSQQAEGCSIETLLVLDATTGQNAVNQAKLFSEVADITGIVLTKLDGTAKGGIIITIHRELGIPVKLVGVGEKIDDLMEFSAKDYADALFATETDFAGNYERLTDDETETTENTAEEAQPADEIEEEVSAPVEEAPVEGTAASEEEIPEINDEEPAPIDMPEEIMDESPVEAMPTEAAEEEIPMPNTEEQPAEPEKKSLKDGKFGFLFKEITFGKKKKDDEEK